MIPRGPRLKTPAKEKSNQRYHKRRQFAEELCAEVKGDYPDPDPLASSESMEFYGQRSVLSDKVLRESINIGMKRIEINSKFRCFGIGF